MPSRRLDPDRLRAAVSAQRAALGGQAWAGPATVSALGAACLDAVAAALDAGVTPQSEALRGAVIYLLGLLEARAPGRAVEVRIPPYAAIQCLAGPRHTRGTPPNVVETDTVTWILLATGRMRWDEAVLGGKLRASGPRADVSDYLPLYPPPAAHLPLTRAGQMPATRSDQAAAGPGGEMPDPPEDDAPGARTT